jgi:heat shock protein 1/8
LPIGRQATTRAAHLAGLERVKLVREPVAAALAYGVDKAGDATVLVFDLGGGTLDVSLLAVGGPTVEVLATSGDTRLGGDDFDDAIARWMAGQMRGGGSGGHTVAALHPAARALREALTGREVVTARLDATTTVQLSRAQLEGLASDLLGRMGRPLEEASWTAGVDLSAARAVRAANQATENAHLTADGRSKGGGKRGRREADKAQREVAGSRGASLRRVDTVILVGGATRMPCVQAFVSSMVAQPVSLGAVDPDEAVALGAALHAGCLDGTVSDVEALETWQAALMRALAANAAAAQQHKADEVEEEVLTRAAHASTTGMTPSRRLPTADEQVPGRRGALSSKLGEGRVKRPGRHLDEELAGAVPVDDTEYDALDLEDIAALGLAEMEEEDMVVYEDEEALRLALGDEAFRRLQATRVDDVQA